MIFFAISSLLMDGAGYKILPKTRKYTGQIINSAPASPQDTENLILTRSIFLSCRNTYRYSTCCASIDQQRHTKRFLGKNLAKRSLYMLLAGLMINVAILLSFFYQSSMGIRPFAADSSYDHLLSFALLL